MFEQWTVIGKLFRQKTSTIDTAKVIGRTQLVISSWVFSPSYLIWCFSLFHFRPCGVWTCQKDRRSGWWPFFPPDWCRRPSLMQMELYSFNNRIRVTCASVIRLVFLIQWTYPYVDSMDLYWELRVSFAREDSGQSQRTVPLTEFRLAISPFPILNRCILGSSPSFPKHHLPTLLTLPFPTLLILFTYLIHPTKLNIV